MATYPDVLGIKDIVQRALQSARVYNDNVAMVIDENADAALYNGGNDSVYTTSLMMIRRKLVLKYFGVDVEFYLSQSYGRWKDLRDLDFYDDKEGTTYVR